MDSMANESSKPPVQGKCDQLPCDMAVHGFASITEVTFLVALEEHMIRKKLEFDGDPMPWGK
jgi:hypothetical protein